MPLVFVYGTLMRAGANHSVLQRLGCTFAGHATTREGWTLVDLGPYPALLPAREGAPTARVFGEVWQIDDHAIRELDAFEGCPELYTRERIALVMASAEDDGGTTSDPETTGDASRPGAAHTHLAARSVTAFAYVLAGRPPSSARVIVGGRYAAPGTALPHGALPEQLAEAPKRRAPASTTTRRRR